MSCQAGPGIEPGPSALKASAHPIELAWQTNGKNMIWIWICFIRILLMRAYLLQTMPYRVVIYLGQEKHVPGWTPELNLARE